MASHSARRWGLVFNFSSGREAKVAEGHHFAKSALISVKTRQTPSKK
jgi:hypothetical protein